MEDTSIGHEQVCCYCAISNDSEMLQCSLCHKLIHPGCLKSGRPSPLAGDVYFEVTCKNCAKDGQDVCIRMHVSWSQAVYLALYNLSMTGSGRKGYFRWKEDICQFIDRNWILLYPKRKRTTSWCSTVAGTLSVGCPQLFRSGHREFKESGWWALQDKVPPVNKLGSPGSEQKRKKNSSKSSNKRKSLPLDTDREELSEAGIKEDKKLKEGNEPFELDKDARELESLFSSVVMETESDELIASLVAEDEERRLSDVSFPFMEMDEPLAFISDNKEDVDSESTANPQEDDKEGEQDGSDDDAESIASTMKSDVKRTIKAKQTLEQDTSADVKKSSLTMVSEADEHEMLCRLNACIQAVQDDCAARRLRRKLNLRKLKRENGLPIFDLDKILAKALSSTKSYVYQEDDFIPVTNDNIKEDPVYMQEKKTTALSQRKTSVLTRYSRVLDRFLAAPQMLRRKEQHSSTFLNRLVGADRQALLRPITSPYTARVLKPFIRRDFESRPMKLRLLNEILTHHKRKDPTWEPPKPHPIDYCYVQPYHIPAVNAMCREFFWPGIDLSECLQYPDFSCVVLYRSFVIAFAFMVPDVKYNEAYISFILVHPEWRRAGIGTYMLYHLIQTCMGKDVTLHVSVTNQAMLMYQKFGFKPEEFILDFYEKYLPESNRECRHAFFLRLRR